MIKWIKRIVGVIIWTAVLWFVLQIALGITDIRRDMDVAGNNPTNREVESMDNLPVAETVPHALVNQSQGSKQVLENERDAQEQHQYAKQFLSADGQLVYNDLFINILNHNTESFEVAVVGKDEFTQAYTALMHDAPEIFYVKSFVYYMDKHDRIQSARIIYNVTKEERERKEKEMEIVVNELLGKVDYNWGDYEKVKYLYDTIIQRTTYDLNAPDHQNIYSVLVGRRSVCAGYARTLQYLMHQLDMVSIYVTGFALNTDGSNIGHAWNLVKMDDEYYHVDATWGDPMFQMKHAHKDYIGYAYFGMTSEDLARTHVVDMDYPLPPAEGMLNNYYVKEKLLVDQTSAGAFLLQALIHGSGVGQRVYSMKCVEGYDTIIEDIFKNGYINKLIRQANDSVSRPYADVQAIYPSPEAKIIDFILDFKDETP